jgi:hypothetical protein
MPEKNYTMYALFKGSGIILRENINSSSYCTRFLLAVRSISIYGNLPLIVLLNDAFVIRLGGDRSRGMLAPPAY